jgi:SAM-dependent methyltransferase
MRVLPENGLEKRAMVVMMALGTTTTTTTTTTPERALSDTQRAFDGVATRYDRSNADNPILRGMRARSRATLESRVGPGSRVLDLGCGPGTDDVPLAGRGYHVTGIDWSPAMVAEARRRVREVGLESSVRIEHLGIHQLDRLAPELFDAAYSSFGALNCVSDLAGAARAIARRLKPGGLLVASAIGRVCPWEFGLYAARGAWSRATLRFARDLVPVPLDGRTVWTRYYAPREFARTFVSAGFALISLRALGLLAPPPYLEGFAERHPALLRRLQRLDDVVGGWRVVRTWGDHFLIVLQKHRGRDPGAIRS